MGTAFLTCPEAGTPKFYKQTLLDTQSDNTVLTCAFAGCYARAIKNRFTDEMIHEPEMIADYPVQLALTKTLRTHTAELQRGELLSFWAGQGACFSTGLPAAELIAHWVNEAQAYLKG